jgi:predicted ArsR family transcriptional regulator
MGKQERPGRDDTRWINNVRRPSCRLSWCEGQGVGSASGSNTTGGWPSAGRPASGQRLTRWMGSPQVAWAVVNRFGVEQRRWVFMTDGDLAERLAGIAALADPIRRDLYLYVSAQPAPVSRDQASDALGIARHTAKFHLDKLAEEGLLDTNFKRLSERRGPGAGRPTKLYTRSSRQLSVTLPERRYDVAGQLLASAIDSATTDGTSVTDAVTAAATRLGRTVGDQLRAAAGSRPSRKRLVDCTCEALANYGYAPTRAGNTIELSNCPFDTLAREHTSLVCGMNLDIMAAITDGVGRDRLAARLDPAPNRCCVVLDAS